MTCCRSCRASDAACELRTPCCIQCNHDPVTRDDTREGTHRIRTYVTEAGFVASCAPCGWRVTCRTRARRDGEASAHTEQPAAAHQLEMETAR